MCHISELADFRVKRVVSFFGERCLWYSITQTPPKNNALAHAN